MTSGSFIFWLVLLGAILWLVLLFVTFRKIACRNDISIVRKAIWIIIIFMAPVVGLIAYLALGKRSIRVTS